MADISEDLTEGDKQSKRNARKCAHISKILMREEYKAQMKKVSEILKKCEAERTGEETVLLEQSPELVKSIEKRNKLRQLNKHRRLEIEDNEEELASKCQQLAQAIRSAKSVVLYTGAGISTAASIPDYRGPSGVWTLLQQGIQPKVQDLSTAEPTYTHMAIKKLHQMGVVKHVVSQNCDGLHMRSGQPRHALSELHGNMFIEVCRSCQPQHEYIRLFDVTERTGVRKHQTGRHCSHCGQELRDCIVHFGERSPGLESPYNWEEAAQAADQADLILCIGSSLKVLRKYPCLWSAHKAAAQRPSLYIVNLQWTPKDESAILKINGKCDVVLKLLLQNMGLTADQYNMNLDPLYCLATPLTPEEIATTSRNILTIPPNYNKGAVLSSIQHEQLRSIERQKRKGKKKKGGGSTGKQEDEAYSNFYKEKLLCSIEETMEELKDKGLQTAYSVVKKAESEVAMETVHGQTPVRDDNRLTSPGRDQRHLQMATDRHYQLNVPRDDPIHDVSQSTSSTNSTPQSPRSQSKMMSPSYRPHASDYKSPEHELISPASVSSGPQVYGYQADMLVDPQQGETVAHPSRPTSTLLSPQPPVNQPPVGHQMLAPTSYPAELALGLLPAQQVLAGGLLQSPLLPFPMALPATSPDLSQDRDLESVKFHQTLQMLQLQSQLHMHQAALTQQLPPGEQDKLRRQQELMRHAFNSLLTQQLIKLEQRTGADSSHQGAAQPPALPGSHMVAPPLWPQGLLAPQLNPTLYPFVYPPAPLPAGLQPPQQSPVSPQTQANPRVVKHSPQSQAPPQIEVSQAYAYSDSYKQHTIGREDHHDNSGEDHNNSGEHHHDNSGEHHHGNSEEHHHGNSGEYHHGSSREHQHGNSGEYHHGNRQEHHHGNSGEHHHGSSGEHHRGNSGEHHHGHHQEGRVDAHQAKVSPTSSNSTLSNWYPTIVSALHSTYSPPGYQPNSASHDIEQISPVETSHSYREQRAVSHAGVVYSDGRPRDVEHGAQEGSPRRQAPQYPYPLPLPAQGQALNSHMDVYAAHSSHRDEEEDPRSGKPKRKRRKKKRPAETTLTSDQVPDSAMMSAGGAVHVSLHTVTNHHPPQMLTPRSGASGAAKEELSPNHVPYPPLSDAHFPEDHREISESDRVKVEGLSTLPVNPMIAIQSRLLAEEEKQSENYTANPELAIQPAIYSSLFSGEVSAVDPTTHETNVLGYAQQEVVIGSPTCRSPSEVVYNNVALTETVVTESEISCTEDIPAAGGSVEVETDTLREQAESPTVSSLNSSPIAMSTPGWFGKGWNPKKYKRRKRSK